MTDGASILVVDDQTLLLDQMRLTLEFEGYRVFTARDGVEALAVLESRSVDLILADIAMPRMNGYQLYQCVVEDSRWVKIPFVFLTARALETDVRYAKELGVDDYVTKPFVPEDLLAVVRGRLRRAQLMKENGSSEPNAQRDTGPGGQAKGQLRIDSEQYCVWRNGARIKMSLREFKLLEHLANRAHKVVPLQELIQTTHGLDVDHKEASGLLRPLIRSVRRKLGYPVGDMGCIQAVRGVGYQYISQKDG